MSDFADTELQEALEAQRNRSLADRPCLRLRARPCGDCAVEGGLYTVFSEALKLASEQERLQHSQRWFCHETPSLACRGNADHLQIQW
jgi:hypothetical protein